MYRKTTKCTIKMADLVVVGAGHLGCRVALKWQKLHPEAKVYLKTSTEKDERSLKWSEAGFVPISDEKGQVAKTPFVVFSAPPTATGALRSLKKSVLIVFNRQ